MSRKPDQGRQEIIEKIAEIINKKLPAKRTKLMISFLRQFYSNVPVEDLEEREVIDLYGAFLSLWNLLYERKPGDCRIRAYNPQYNEDGWQSTHTIIEISHDDMPFLIDSLLMEINRLGFAVHLIIHMGGIKLRRDVKGCVLEVLPLDAPAETSMPEAPIYIEIDRQTDPKILEELQQNLLRVLADVRLAVQDWKKICSEMMFSLEELEKSPPPLSNAEISESKDYLRWLLNNHFTFLGYREYELSGKGDQFALRRISNSGLGLLRDKGDEPPHVRFFSTLPPEALEIALSPQILVMSKTNTKSVVHRSAYMDYIGIKRFNAKGEVIGERRFIGLYTSSTYTESPLHIPFLRHKVTTVMTRSQLPPGGHAGKALLNILETLPRDDLIQSSADELFDISMGILHLQERQKIRLFIRKDIYNRFVSCFVYVPRDRVSLELRQAVQSILMQAFNGVDCDSFIDFLESSILARIHCVIRVDMHKPLIFDLKAIEHQIVEAGRSWSEELLERLCSHFGEEKGNLLAHKYSKAFPAGYRDDFDARMAIYDIEYMEKLSSEHPLEMNFYRSVGKEPGVLRFRLFQSSDSIPLSDVLPILENMGLRVLGELPHELVFKNGSRIWINDFSMVHAHGDELDIAAIRDIFQDIFQKIWCKEVENDAFNKLGLSAGLNWREISILRAYTKYLRQIGLTFGQSYTEDAVVKNPSLARCLVQLFKLRFDPEDNSHRALLAEEQETKLTQGLNEVVNLDEDRILRRFHELIKATLRTNYFQKNTEGKPKSYLSFKFDPNLIVDLPLPRPMFEIFVYSPRFEGIHLRAGKVARGGLRWSDRREDFRTEVLGLMKAQQVKNAVIVPSGAKGGFVVKCPPSDGNRDAILEEGIRCYKDFIRGLLDLTDNLKNQEIIVREDTLRYDGDDIYLVVAADKGTATFSDIANGISKEYDFWLGDAFASGGSAGYDHKKMGITARGAWESVKRHFGELGLNPQESDIRVVGIGDMAGDVFGNGMLMSQHIKLIGAFNHIHIFLDPDPDPKKSYLERERLFNLPRSNWDDYDPTVMSKGGGVFKRSAKSITLSPEIKKQFGITVDQIVPNDLIQLMLKADVDLLWNGGIGTFAKASSERHVDVGDRSNDSIRVNANDLRCRVVGEGGNLGLTQLARVEYSLKGGLVYTDFIDNSAGVDCSDHEVNIKILLNNVVMSGDMTIKQRNQLLAEMTDEVAQLVLRDNYYQTRALSLAASQASTNVDLYCRYLDEQARQGRLDRTLEFLPDDKILLERKALGQGLTRPELAILLAYCKINIEHDILNSKLPEDPYLSHVIEKEFPTPLRKRFAAQMETHSLRREIIATQLSNSIVNHMGITFVHRLHDETGAPLSPIVRAYIVASNVFGMQDLMKLLESLDYKIPPDVQIKMMTRVMRLIRRATRWFLRNRRVRMDIASTIEHFSGGVAQLYDQLPNLLPNTARVKLNAMQKEFVTAGVPTEIAHRIAITSSMFSVLDIIETATVNELSINEVATVYFALDERLGLGWFRDQISNHPVATHWDALARAALRDDLDWQQRGLTTGIVRLQPKLKDTETAISTWIAQHKPLVKRWESMLAELKAATQLEFIMFSVAARELLDLTQASIQVVKSIKVTRKGGNNGQQGKV